MIVTCTLATEPAPSQQRARSGDDPVVDVHCHALTDAARELVEAHYPPHHILANDPYQYYSGPGSIETNKVQLPRIKPKMTDPQQRLADMDAMGVDVQVLAPFVTQNYYWVDGDLGAQSARLQNERLAEMAASAPDRFAVLGQVPMQDSARAVAELEHVVQRLGFKGVQISGNVAGRDLDDPRFAPFFDRAAELGAVVLIHPDGFSHGQRLTDYFLVNVLGNPLDSTLALSRLILSGTLARLPELKLVVVHGGGYLPFYWARMDHAWRARPEVREAIPDHEPSTYLRRVHFDTMVFHPEQVRTLVDFAGVDHVLMGTDYPFDMGEEDPVGLVGAVEGLSDDERAAIRGRNAVELFGLS